MTFGFLQYALFGFNQFRTNCVDDIGDFDTKFIRGCRPARRASRQGECDEYGVAGTDAGSLLAVVLLLAGTGIAAAWIPAFRVARVEPMTVLRSE